MHADLTAAAVSRVDAGRDESAAPSTNDLGVRVDPGPRSPRARLPQVEVAPTRSLDRGRVVGLDGIRGLAALYVVVHHCWLLTFHGYPANTGPVWLGWLLYGHLAVVVFITLSGFSLAVSPARNGWQLDKASPSVVAPPR